MFIKRQILSQLERHLTEPEITFLVGARQVGKTTLLRHYWRTSDGSEIDFVIDKFTDVVPVEIKFKQMLRLSLTKAFHSFIRRYKPSTGYLINLNLADEIRIDTTSVKLCLGMRF